MRALLLAGSSACYNFFVVAQICKEEHEKKVSRPLYLQIKKNYLSCINIIVVSEKNNIVL